MADISKINPDGTEYDLKDATARQDLSLKADKVTSATNGNLAGLDANGNLTDSGIIASRVVVTSNTSGLLKNDGSVDTTEYASESYVDNAIPIIDTELSSTSTNPVQNKAITNVIPDKGFGDTWLAKTWNGFTSFYGNYIWTDRNNIYYSNNSEQYVLDKSTSTWNPKTWNGFTSFNGNYIWTDGDNIYYSYSSTSQYVLDKSTSTWSTKTWSGLTSFGGLYIWTDGENIYYSSGSTQYVLDKSTSTWSTKTWNGLTNFRSDSIWTDGDNIYYSYGSKQYVLDKSTSTWSTKTWSGLTSFDGFYIWTDGDNIYYSYNLTQYTLSIQKGFGTSATKDFTESVTSGSKDLVTSGAVAEALSDYVEPNPQDTASESLTKLKIGDDVFNVGGGNTEYTELTQAQYDALSQAEKENGELYFITDGEGGGTDISGKTDLTMIAPVEAGATSSRAYAIGEEFIIGGILRRAKDAIAQGDAFTSSNTELAPSVTEQIIFNLGTPQAITGTADYTVPHDGYIRAYFNYNDVGKYGMEFFLNSIKFAAMADVKTAAGYGGAQSLYVPKGTVIKFYDTSGVYNVYYTPNMNR